MILFLRTKKLPKKVRREMIFKHGDQEISLVGELHGLRWWRSEIDATITLKCYIRHNGLLGYVCPWRRLWRIHEDTITTVIDFSDEPYMPLRLKGLYAKALNQAIVLHYGAVEQLFISLAYDVAKVARPQLDAMYKVHAQAPDVRGLDGPVLMTVMNKEKIRT